MEINLISDTVTKPSAEDEKLPLSPKEGSKSPQQVHKEKEIKDKCIGKYV